MIDLYIIPRWGGKNGTIGKFAAKMLPNLPSGPMG
jgi:hypothetical protein